MQQLILGSQSKTRRRILEFFKIPFHQIGSNFNEETVPFTGNPELYVQILSQHKAESLVRDFPKDIILTADTVVFFKQKIYHKPKTSEEACQFLKDFSGHWQQVFTGVTVIKDGQYYSGFKETKLLFNSLSSKHIQKYHQSYYALDKCGGYSIDQGANILISKIDGCHYNVLGLPISLTAELLLKAGVDLWDYLKPSMHD